MFQQNSTEELAKLEKKLARINKRYFKLKEKRKKIKTRKKWLIENHGKFRWAQIIF